MTTQADTDRVRRDEKGRGGEMTRIMDNLPLPPVAFAQAILNYPPLSEAMCNLLRESSRLTGELMAAINDPDNHDEDGLAHLVRNLQAAQGRARGAYELYGARRLCTQCLKAFVPKYVGQEECCLDCCEAADEAKAVRDGSAPANGVTIQGGLQCKKQNSEDGYP